MLNYSCRFWSICRGLTPPGRRAALTLAASLVCSVALGTLAASDWPHQRGPAMDGTTTDTNLPASWSPAGENLAWRAPYGSRSAPLVLGDRVILQNTSGQRETTQERIMSLDANTGKVVWERKYSLYLSDVPMHRVAWSSPVGDPITGNIYAVLGNGRLMALDREGKQLWERSLNEEFGVVTTHGGRMASPVLDGDLVIASMLHAGWGDFPRPGNRWTAFDRTTGKTVWISSPQQRHYDTNYAPGYVMTHNGMRLLIWPGTDGVVYGMKVRTGEVVWKHEFSKRALNTGVVAKDGMVVFTHSEENLDTNQMGMIGALDAGLSGAITKDQIKWSTYGFEGGYASPVIAGDVLYHVDNTAVVGAFDLPTGKQLWAHRLGTIHKAPLAYGDGKLYVGTENGKFFILQPSREGVKVLDEDLLGTDQAPEPVIAGAAIGGGRVFVASMDALYAIGKGGRSSSTSSNGGGAGPRDRAGAFERPGLSGQPNPAGSSGAPTHLQIVPAEATLAPGEKVTFEARLFDARGEFVRTDRPAWTLENVQGTITPDGMFSTSETTGQWGLLKATSGNLTAAARVRVVPALPWTYDFESLPKPPAHWVNVAGKFELRDLDGSKVLVRLEDNTVGRRTRVGMGVPAATAYTIDADVRSATRRRQQGDIGLINQRYALVLFGNAQKLELQPWQPATPMTVSVPFKWQPDVWYRMKLRAENLPDGTTKVQGKVWPKADAEPAAWTIEKIDKIPHREGSPGLYADASTDLFFDNITVVKNR